MTTEDPTTEEAHPTLTITLDLTTGTVLTCDKSEKLVKTGTTVRTSSVPFQCPFCAYVWKRRVTSKLNPRCPKCLKAFPARLADPKVRAVREMSDEEYAARVKKGMEQFRGIAGL